MRGRFFYYLLLTFFFISFNIMAEPNQPFIPQGIDIQNNAALKEFYRQQQLALDKHDYDSADESNDEDSNNDDTDTGGDSNIEVVSNSFIKLYNNVGLDGTLLAFFFIVFFFREYKGSRSDKKDAVKDKLFRKELINRIRGFSAEQDKVVEDVQEMKTNMILRDKEINAIMADYKIALKDSIVKEIMDKIKILNQADSAYLLEIKSVVDGLNKETKTTLTALSYTIENYTGKFDADIVEKTKLFEELKTLVESVYASQARLFDNTKQTLDNYYLKSKNTLREIKEELLNRDGISKRELKYIIEILKILAKQGYFKIVRDTIKHHTETKNTANMSIMIRHESGIFYNVIKEFIIGINYHDSSVILKIEKHFSNFNELLQASFVSILTLFIEEHEVIKEDADLFYTLEVTINDAINDLDNDITIDIKL